MIQSKTKKLAELTTKVGSGSTPRGGKNAYHNSGVPLIRSLNVHFDGFRRDGLAYLDDRQALALRAVEVRGGDVLLNITGASIGRVTVAPENMDGARVNQHVCIIRPTADLDASFLRWYLASPLMQDEIMNVQSGATRQALTKEKVLDFDIPLLPLTQQKFIVAEIEKQFSRLDEAVANLKRVKANLKRYKAAVLKAAVEGRLVETEAELARREGRSYETGAELLHRILETRRSQWKGKGKYKEPASPDTSDLPELPEGWVWASLDSLSWDSGYGTSAKCSRQGKGIAVLRIPNVRYGVIDLFDLKFAESDLSFPSGSLLDAGDMLVIRTNGSKALIGSAAVLSAKPSKPLAFASYLIRFRMCDYEQIARWVNTTWAESRIRTWIESRAATSAGQYNISQGVLATAAIPIPPAAEQCRILVEVDQRLSIAQASEAAIVANMARARQLRDAILADSFSPQINQQEQEGIDESTCAG